MFSWVECSIVFYSNDPLSRKALPSWAILSLGAAAAARKSGFKKLTKSFCLPKTRRVRIQHLCLYLCIWKLTKSFCLPRPGEYAMRTTHTTLVFVFVYLEVEKSLCLPSQQKKVCLQHFRSFFGQIQIITHFSLTFIILVVCKNESFCHRNHFRELYVASIRR